MKGIFMKKIIFFSILSVICRICASENQVNDKWEPNNVEDSQFVKEIVMQNREEERRMESYRMQNREEERRMESYRSRDSMEEGRRRDPMKFFFEPDSNYYIRRSKLDNGIIARIHGNSRASDIDVLMKMADTKHNIKNLITIEGLYRVARGLSPNGQDEKEKQLLRLLAKREEEIKQRITVRDCFNVGLFEANSSENWENLISMIGKDKRVSILHHICNSFKQCKIYFE